MQDQEASSEAEATVIWTVTEPNDLVYAQVLEILFGPDTDDMAA